MDYSQKGKDHKERRNFCDTVEDASSIWGYFMTRLPNSPQLFQNELLITVIILRFPQFYC